MEKLADKLKKVSDESWETWFDRCYKKRELEHQLLISASNGSYGVYICPDKESYYTKLRMKDDRFMPKLREKLGTGMKISSEMKTINRLFLGESIEECIVIRW